MPIKLDLNGPEGNAFALLGLVNKIGKQIGLDPKEIKAIQAEMMSDDYEHLLSVLRREFGDVIEFA